MVQADSPVEMGEKELAQRDAHIRSFAIAQVCTCLSQDSCGIPVDNSCAHLLASTQPVEMSLVVQLTQLLK